MLSFLMKLKIKNCNKIFNDELGEGILMTQIIDFHANKDDLENAMFIVSLIEAEDAFVENNIEVITTLIDDK